MNDAMHRARSLIGRRFRPQGRDPDLGIDCVGLVSVVFAIPPESIPRDYRLRGAMLERLKLELERFFQPISATAAGDVLICRVAVDQLHLGILSDRGFIHADARLRRVVETVGAPPWPIVSAYRRKVQKA